LWGAGSLLGPVAGTAAMQALPPHGLMWFVAAGALLFLISLLQRAPRALGELT
jgi:hypothetical protein